MNIEHNVNTQELTEEDYTKVYAGYGHSLLLGEDLMNIIYDISPETTPLQSNIGQETVSNTLFEWQTDSLY